MGLFQTRLRRRPDWSPVGGGKKRLMREAIDKEKPGPKRNPCVKTHDLLKAHIEVGWPRSASIRSRRNATTFRRFRLWVSTRHHHRLPSVVQPWSGGAVIPQHRLEVQRARNRYRNENNSLRKNLRQIRLTVRHPLYLVGIDRKNNQKQCRCPMAGASWRFAKKSVSPRNRRV